MIRKEIKELDLPGEIIAPIQTTSQLPQIGFFLFIGGNKLRGIGRGPGPEVCVEPAIVVPQGGRPHGSHRDLYLQRLAF